MKYLFLFMSWLPAIAVNAQQDSPPAAEPCRIVTNIEMPDFSELDSSVLVTWVNSYVCQTADCSVYLDAECALTNFHLLICDRWGNRMFETDKQGDKWPAAGTAEGTYVWVLTGRLPSGKPIRYHGHFVYLEELP